MAVPRKLIQFRKNNRGATAVEFAMLAAPLFLLLIGTVQLGVIFLANQTLDAAIDNAGRLIQTGQLQGNGTDIDELKTLVCDQIPFLSSCEDNIQISINAFQEFADIDPDNLFTASGFPVVNNNFQPGLRNEIVVMTAVVSVPVLSGEFLPITSQQDGNLLLSSSLVFRNEAFN